MVILLSIMSNVNVLSSDDVIKLSGLVMVELVALSFRLLFRLFLHVVYLRYGCAFWLASLLSYIKITGSLCMDSSVLRLVGFISLI